MITNELTVTYVDHMGSDLSVVQDARVSFTCLRCELKVVEDHYSFVPVICKDCVTALHEERRTFYSEDN
jgi:hypothetical protein